MKSEQGMESKSEGLERKTMEFLICSIVQFSLIALREVIIFILNL